MTMTWRPDSEDYAAALADYVAEIEEHEDVVSVLDDQLQGLQARLGSLPGSRGERTPQPPFDDQSWVAETGADHRSLADMVEEWGLVRGATLALLRPLARRCGSDEAWPATGRSPSGPSPT